MADLNSAREVADEFQRRLPGIGVKKLHKLLYFAQGHHLADVGELLFVDDIEAWDHGPVVASLWRQDKHGATALIPPAPLQESALNTIGYVVARYGHMTAADLEDLSHRQQPWALVDQQRRLTGEQTIGSSLIRAYFDQHQRPTDQAAEYEDDYEPDAGKILEWLEGAPARLSDDLSVDDVESLRAIAQQ